MGSAGGGVGILALTVYLESNYQQREARIDRAHAVKDSAPEPSPPGLDARVIPKGFNPLDLPGADSRGATLLTLYCVQCHNLPTPLMHSAEEWPAIIDRMQRHMGSRSTGMLAHVIMPAEKDWQQSVDTAEGQIDGIRRQGNSRDLASLIDRAVREQ